MENNLSYFGKEIDLDIIKKVQDLDDFLRKKLKPDQLKQYEAYMKNFKSTQIRLSKKYMIEALDYLLKYTSESDLSPDVKKELISEIKKIKNEIDPPNYTLYIISVLLLIILLAILAFYFLKKK